MEAQSVSGAAVTGAVDWVPPCAIHEDDSTAAGDSPIIGSGAAGSDDVVVASLANRMAGVKLADKKVRADKKSGFSIKVDGLTLPGPDALEGGSYAGRHALEGALTLAFRNRFPSVTNCKVVTVRRGGHGSACFAFVNFADQAEQQAAFKAGAPELLHQISEVSGAIFAPLR